MTAPPNFKEGVVPHLLGKEKRNDRKLHQSYVESEVPHAGAWFQRNQIPQNTIDKLNNSSIKDMDPAGIRIPRSFKLA